jgi:beta-glucosidase
VGNPEFMKAGYEAQLKSLVLLKNKSQVLPLRKGVVVYIPKRTIPSGRDWFGNTTPERQEYPVNMDIVKKYFSLTEDPEKADVALVVVKSPDGGVGYNSEDRKKGGNGYVPISLQYGPYVAKETREKSIAAGDPVIDPTIKDRSYRGKEITSANVSDLQSILNTKAAMKGKPVIVMVQAAKPMVFSEFENQVHAILYGFGVMDQAVMDIISGASEPSALLPVQMPANMETVEQQFEDVPRDMKVQVDTEGHAYDFGFGMNWKGVIADKRVTTYKGK